MCALLKMPGNHKNLLVYQLSEVTYDITFYFINKYLKPGDRTRDQMEQAARSGQANIAEGNEAATTSRETQLKLTNVSKASFKELMLDYENYLRTHNLTIWDKTHPRYEGVRRYVVSGRAKATYNEMLPRLNDEEISNLALTLIHIIDAMLRKLILSQEDKFLREGGIREKLSKARKEIRGD